MAPADKPKPPRPPSPPSLVERVDSLQEEINALRLVVEQMQAQLEERSGLTHYAMTGWRDDKLVASQYVQVVRANENGFNWLRANAWLCSGRRWVCSLRTLSSGISLKEQGVFALRKLASDRLFPEDPPEMPEALRLVLAETVFGV